MRFLTFLIFMLYASIGFCQDPLDRTTQAEAYLSEFASPAFKNIPKIYTALKNVLVRMPYEDYLKVTDRSRPIFFTEVYDAGTAQYANSAEIIAEEGEEPCCQKGFTMIKLSVGLAKAKDSKAIEGVVAHEVAHRVLDHVKKGRVNCAAEREANALIRQWGFGGEFKQASKTFGSRKGDPAACQE